MTSTEVAIPDTERDELYANKTDQNRARENGGALSDTDARLAEYLSTGLAEKRIEPYFQPIVSLSDSRILGMEVLARWHDPALGEIKPTTFIRIAEQFGLLDRLSTYLMHSAFAAASAWPQQLFLSFNISPKQLHDPDLTALVSAAAAQHAFPLTCVHLEITESALIENLPKSAATLDKLIDMGCVIAIDDFGTGYSSLSWLSMLPFSTIKIDASFIAAMETHRPSRKIVAAVIGLAHSLGLAVVAEGVETVTQANVLRRMGCNLAQGFLFGRPRPAHEMPALLANHAWASGDADLTVPISLESSAGQISELYRSEATSIAFIDPRGRVVASNVSFDRTMAATTDTATGRHLWELTSVTPEMFAELRALHLLGEPFPALEETTPSGALVLVIIRPVQDEGQELLGFSIVCLDISRERSDVIKNPPLSTISDPGRLRAVADTGILASTASGFFTTIVTLAADVLGAPYAAITVVEKDRMIFWSSVGISDVGPTSRAIPLDRSISQYVVSFGQPLIVDDARTSHVLKQHPAVLDGSVMSYIGLPLISPDGHTIGALSVADTKTHHWGTAQVEILGTLAAQVHERVFTTNSACQQVRQPRQPNRIHETRQLTAATTKAGSVRAGHRDFAARDRPQL